MIITIIIEIYGVTFRESREKEEFSQRDLRRFLNIRPKRTKRTKRTTLLQVMMMTS